MNSITMIETYLIVAVLTLSHGLAYILGSRSWSKLLARKAYSQGYSDATEYCNDRWVRNVKDMAECALAELKKAYNAGISVIREPELSGPPGSYKNGEFVKLPTVSITITVNHTAPYYWKISGQEHYENAPS